MTPGQGARDSQRAAHAYCDAMLAHYENFTVASRLSPRRLRRDLAAVYAFCRFTDDLGDESASPGVALRRLERWRDETLELFEGTAPAHPILVALAGTLRRHSLPADPFLDLIAANVQDQQVARYEDWPRLRAYCMMSAAPVGRIVLRLNGIADGRLELLSDDVCIGLQLANFAQDVRGDAQRGRTYLLQEDIRHHGEAGAVRAMCERARALLATGRELEQRVPWRLRIQLALYRLGGEAILDAIARGSFSTADSRPVVRGARRLGVGAAAIATVMHGG